MVKKIYLAPASTLVKAKRLRKRQTLPEKILWQELRNTKFLGLKFRRQAPLGPFIVDFLCAEKMLIIEIDGESHFLPGAAEYDAHREEFLRGHGFEVVRFSNAQTISDCSSVLRELTNLLQQH